MRRREWIRLVAMATVLASIYYALLAALGVHLTVIPAPTWWADEFGSRNGGAVAWLVANHAFTLVVASLPVVLLAFFTGGRRRLLALMVAVLLVIVFDSLQAIIAGVWRLRFEAHPVLSIAEMLELAAVPLILYWAIRAFPSNNPLGARA